MITLLLFAFFAPQLADESFRATQKAIVDNASWFYVLSVAVILTVVVYLGLSRTGDVRLGPDHVKPDYSLLSWLSMLFAAGMGIGLMFFGVAEPLMHYMAPPLAEPDSVQAMRDAMKLTFFHWGFHAWAIYAVVALILAYFSFRHSLPLTLRSALYPLIGDKIYGWPGHIVDIFAVISTIFGIATSLGLGAAQINSGLSYLFGMEVNASTQVWLMAGIIAIAVLSVLSGLDKGIRILSEANMLMALALLAFILITGSTVFLLKAYMQNLGGYFTDFVHNTFNLFAYEKKEWLGGWTIFYWGWWLAWAPFVGLFIARISKGRTIREFIVGVLVIPSAFTLFWMTVFGNSAIELVAIYENSGLRNMVEDNTAVALFVFLEHFPLSDLLSFIAIVMVVIFFVTSCDSGAMVVNMLCSYGNNNTPHWQRIYWTLGVGVVAAILLSAGGLNSLQTMTITAALPFAVILLLALIGLTKSLRVEAFKRESLQMNVLPQGPNESRDDWKERLRNIINFPDKEYVLKFMQDTVLVSLRQVETELKQYDIEVSIQQEEGHIELVVHHGDEHDFIYGVHCRKYVQPDFANAEIDAVNPIQKHTYFRAEVHLREGGQDYDIMGWSTLAVINDILDQYNKHQHFLHLLR